MPHALHTRGSSSRGLPCSTSKRESSLLSPESAGEESVERSGSRGEGKEEKGMERCLAQPLSSASNRHASACANKTWRTKVSQCFQEELHAVGADAA